MKRILKAVAAFFSWLTLPTALALGRRLGWMYGSIIRYHRKDAVVALTRGFPGKSPAEIQDIVRRMYSNLGMNMAEMLRLGTITHEDVARHITIEGADNMQRARDRGKGVIVLCGHIGNWELLANVSPTWDYPLTIIAKELKNKAVNDYWAGVRQRFGLKIVGPKNSYRTCLKSLRHGGIIGFMLDQNMIRREGIFVDFFGKKANTTPGLAYMAAHSGAPVVPAYILRTDDPQKHILRMLPPMDPPADSEPETIHEYTQRCTKILEDIIRQYPDQWIWVHRRWRAVPIEEEQAEAEAGR